MLERALKELSEAKTESAARRALAGYSKKDLDFIAEKHGIKGRSSQAVIDQLVARVTGKEEPPPLRLEGHEALHAPRARLVETVTNPDEENILKHEYKYSVGWKGGPPKGMTQQEMDESADALFRYAAELEGATPWEIRDSDKPEDVARSIRAIDRIMDASPLESDIRVFRGLSDPGKALGNIDRDLTGMVIPDHGFMSTTPNREIADKYAGDSKFVFEIEVPKGTGAIQVQDEDLDQEVLLDRGLELHVVGDTGPGSSPRVVRVRAQRQPGPRPSPIKAIGRAAVPGASTARRPVRPALRTTRSPEEAAQVTSRQLRSITGRDIPVSFKGAMTEDAQQFGEALLSSMDDFPDVRLRAVDTYGHGGSAPHQSWMDEPEMKASLAVTDHLDVNGNSQILFNNDRAGVLPYLTEYSHQHGFLAGPGVPDIATHEFGHSLLSHLLEGHGDRPFDAYQVIQLIHRFAERAGQLKPIGYRSPDGMHHMRAVEFLAAQISGYAAIPERGGYYNVQEIVAEAFTQVRLGRGSPLSRAIYDLLVKEYRRLGGSV
jgi:hypothetical protein